MDVLEDLDRILIRVGDVARVGRGEKAPGDAIQISDDPSENNLLSPTQRSAGKKRRWESSIKNICFTRNSEVIWTKSFFSVHISPLQQELVYTDKCNG